MDTREAGRPAEAAGASTTKLRTLRVRVPATFKIVDRKIPMARDNCPASNCDYPSCTDPNSPNYCISTCGFAADYAREFAHRTISPDHPIPASSVDDYDNIRAELERIRREEFRPPTDNSK